MISEPFGEVVSSHQREMKRVNTYCHSLVQRQLEHKNIIVWKQLGAAVSEVKMTWCTLKWMLWYYKISIIKNENKIFWPNASVKRSLGLISLWQKVVNKQILCTIFDYGPALRLDKNAHNHSASLVHNSLNSSNYAEFTFNYLLHFLLLIQQKFI